MNRLNLTQVLLLLFLATTAVGDIKIKTRNGAAGQSYESTVYIKGARERNESAIGGRTTTTIYQCDLKRFVTLFDDKKMYMITPLETEEVVTSEPGMKAPPKPQEPAATRQGGTVVLTTANIDTSERQQLFGMNARHVRQKCRPTAR